MRRPSQARRKSSGRARGRDREAHGEAPEEAPPSTGHEDAHPGPEHWKEFRLSDFQREAIGAIQSGHNVLVSAPTGAGKTLVAEYAIVDAVRAGRRCIYTAPIKALSNQKYRDFRDEPGIDVGLMTGDVTIRPEAQVLIMTTEILRNTIFEDPESLHDVEYVIFDEVHYMDDVERGTVWEESLIFAPPDVRFVCLSATIPNLQELGTWLGEIRRHPIRIVCSERRPVPLHFRLYARPGGSFELSEIGEVRRKAARGEKAPTSRRRSKRGGRRGPLETGGDLPPNPGPLFDALTRDGLLPALVFAFSRRDCERLARDNAHRDLLDEDERRRMEDLQAELARLFQLPESALDDEAFRMARRGVGYHHAGCLPITKEIVERMFTSGLLKLLFTTETFALGINMPARTAVFHSLRKFDGVSFDYMRTRDFLQMAGRAGRQGIDDEGLVYALLGTRSLFEAPLERLFGGRPEPVESRFRLAYSSLLHLVAGLGRARVHEAWEKSFNNFQHRETSKKARERNMRRQHRTIDAQLAFLDELGYLDGDELTPRGRIARRINGFELQVTELLFRGVLENLSPEALAVVFVGLSHEDRRRGEPTYVSSRLYGDLRRSVDAVTTELAHRTFRHGDIDTPRPASWSLTSVVVEWCRGAPFETLEPASDASPGDLCRSLRMGIQVMRQARRAIDEDWDLHARLGEAMALVSRDEVDARRQLELG